MRRKHEQLALGCTEDEAAHETEPLDQAVEDDPRLDDGIARLVEASADVDHRLKIGPALAELALVDRREDRRGKREQPERRHAQEGHAFELDLASGNDVHRREEVRGLGVQDDEQQQRVPQRDLEAGPIRGKERHGDEVQVDEEPERALRSAGHVHRRGQEGTVDQEHHREEAVVEPC